MLTCLEIFGITTLVTPHAALLVICRIEEIEICLPLTMTSAARTAMPLGQRMSWYLEPRRGRGLRDSQRASRALRKHRKTDQAKARIGFRSNSAHGSSSPRHQSRELCSQQTLSIACHWSCAAPQLEGFSFGQWRQSGVELRLPEDPHRPGIPVSRAGSSVQQPTAFLIISPRPFSRRTSFLRVLHPPRPVSFPFLCAFLLLRPS